MAESKPTPGKKRPPAKTPEAREAQLIAMAYDHAETQFRNGEASSQVTTHFLKMGSTRELKELKKIELDTKLAEAKIRQIDSVEEMKVLFKDAMEALTGYKRGPEL